MLRKSAPGAESPETSAPCLTIKATPDTLNIPKITEKIKQKTVVGCCFFRDRNLFEKRLAPMKRRKNLSPKTSRRDASFASKQGAKERQGEEEGEENLKILSAFAPSRGKWGNNSL
jgi:hypothetical protein